MKRAGTFGSFSEVRFQWLLMLLVLSQIAVGQESQPEHLQSIAYLAYSDDGYWQVWRMTPDGQRQVQVTHSPYDKSRVSWYPDGKRLLVNGNQGSLVQVEITSGAETPIPLHLVGMNDAVLSPDGQAIAFSLSTADSIDNNNIWVAHTDGSQPRKLTHLPYLQHEPAWSPDSQALYFLSGKGDQSHDIWRLNLADGALTQLTVGQLYHFNIAVGPDNRLAYSSNRSGNYEIWLWPQDDQPRPLTHHPALDAWPSWSPDGRLLVFESTRSGVSNIWRLSLAGGEPQPLTQHPRGARLPVWGPGDTP